MSTRQTRAKRAALAERDGWRCAFCGEAIDPTLSAPDARAATVHHVRPRRRGGRHELANLQLMHDECHRMHHAARFSERLSPERV